MDLITTLISDIKTFDETTLKNYFYEVGGVGPETNNAYPHQLEALRRIEIGAGQVPPVSGIIHYPTGAGKTRVGMEVMARALRQNPDHRFIWATHTKNLIRQSMVQMAELSRLFPSNTRFTWARNADAVECDEGDMHVVFMTRNTLTEVLDRASDRRRNHPWRLHLEERRPMTLIYDECHQMGAEKLQDNWSKFHGSVVAPPRAWRRPWRTIGLSATPVPTQLDSHDLLADVVFPLRKETPPTGDDWPFHVFHRVRNETLIQSKVLCPINMFIDQDGGFDLPADLLRRIIGDSHLAPPGAHADKTIIQKYAMQFNSKVLADPRVLAFLADKLGKNVGLTNGRSLLGKTIVFLPNIDAANRMAGLLYDRFPALRGSVAVVHSRMGQLTVPGQGEASVHEVLDRFRRYGDRPSILVNVDMLTEGFDDPLIRTVVLARLTLSTNRFWQMIGRGTRGTAARGTTDCNVIDPVKLTRLYNYFGGYQPSFSRDDNLEFEDSDEPGAGEGRLSPQVPAITRPPDPGQSAYSIDPELERIHAQVAIALRHFLSGEALSEKQAIEAALHTCVELTDGSVVLRPSDGAFDPTTAIALLLGEISILERRAGVDLAWFRQQLPATTDEVLLKQRMRMLRAVESLRLWTESAFAAAQMSGAFLAALQEEAKGSAVSAVGGQPGAPEGVGGRAADSAEEAALDALLAIAAADGSIADAEVSVIAETLRLMFGRAPTPEVEQTIRSRPAPSAVPFDHLEATIAPPERQLLLLQMAKVAAADGIVTSTEREMLDIVAARLHAPAAFVDAVLGGYLARSEVGETAPAVAAAPAAVCGACTFAPPPDATFCPSCGTRLR